MYPYSSLSDVEVPTALLFALCGCFLFVCLFVCLWIKCFPRILYSILMLPPISFQLHAPSPELTLPEPTATFTLDTISLRLELPSSSLFSFLCSSLWSVVFTLPKVELTRLSQKFRGKNRAGAKFLVLLWKLALEYQKGRSEGSRS